MKTKTAKSKRAVHTIATITADPDPANMQPFTLIYQTKGATRRYPFTRIVEAIYLAKMIDRRIRISVEALPV